LKEKEPVEILSKKKTPGEGEEKRPAEDKEQDGKDRGYGPTGHARTSRSIKPFLDH
jgi:hypothetical protein